MLEAVFAWAGQRMRQDIRIYHVNELFNAITQKLSEERRFPKSGGGVFATTQLETDKYTFDPGKIGYIQKMIKEKNLSKIYIWYHNKTQDYSFANFSCRNGM